MAEDESSEELLGLVDRVFDKVYRPDLLLKEDLADSELDELIGLAKTGRLAAFDAAGVIRLHVARRIAVGATLSHIVRATILSGFISLATPQQCASFFLPEIGAVKPSRGRPKGTGRKEDLFLALVAYGSARGHLKPKRALRRGESPQQVLATELGLSVRQLQRAKQRATAVIGAAKK